MELTEQKMQMQPAPELTHADPQQICRRIVEILDAKKATELTALHVTEQTVIADYFVLCTATSSTHVKALADEVEFRMQQSGVTLLRSEGAGADSWVILDYGCVMVHIFTPAARQFYNLEKLWGDAQAEDFLSLAQDETGG